MMDIIMKFDSLKKRGVKGKNEGKKERRRGNVRRFECKERRVKKETGCQERRRRRVKIREREKRE